jgi:Fe-S-cluster containining protein
MPPERQEIILERFAAAREKLADAEMLDPLLHPDLYGDEQMRSLGREYFKLGISCPFLEDESCSIYLDRPITCREYLVTSPAVNCSAPSPQTVQVVPMLAGAVWTAVARLEEDQDSRFIRWVPLILALEFAASAEADPRPREGKDWIQEFFRLVAREPKGQQAKAT